MRFFFLAISSAPEIYAQFVPCVHVWYLTSGSIVRLNALVAVHLWVEVEEEEEEEIGIKEYGRGDDQARYKSV